MKIRIQWKLMISYLLLIILMAGTLFFYMNRTLERHLVTETTENLLNESRLAGLMATKETTDLQHDGPALANAIGAAIKARVTLIDRNGTVAGDSGVSAEEVRDLENHAGRPEVRQALEKGTGSSIRHSATLRLSMLYVATVFSTRGGETGVIRLALPLSALQHTQATFQHALLAAITLALFLALLLSYVLSRVTSRSLRTMASIATLIGRGDFNRRIPVHSDDELGELAEVMNIMSTQIAEQMQRLSSEKSRLDTILRGMGEGLMVIDTQGTIAMVNPAFLSLFEMREEVQGRSLIEITRHPGLNDTFRRILTSGTDATEEINLPGGKTILTHWVPLLDHEYLQGVVAVFHDISEIKKLENIRKDFVANVSHELRTPVTVIKGYAETLLSGVMEQSPERARNFLEIIHRHSERLAGLIKDLLTLSELESGKLSLQLGPMAVFTVVATAVNLLKEKADEKGIELIAEDMHETPPVLGDRGRLEQVLINLLDNAVKYTPQGGAITISALAAQDMVEVSVRDTGIGIPEKEMQRLFERFYRVDEARSREQGGTGLGLSIVKHIIQLHGGTVGVQSIPGKGSTFSFSLKKAKAEEPKADITGGTGGGKGL